ncbi:MAG: 3-phosphoshikimate 1-carboxyvinyltransferase [Phycisphaerales bacterium]
MSQPPNPLAGRRSPLPDLQDPFSITPITRPFDARIRPPGSKSLTNRALFLAALARGTSTLRAPLIDAEDAAVMIEAVRALGAEVTRVGDDLRVTGVEGRWQPKAIGPGAGVMLDLRNAGTATRFLTAGVLLSPVPITIDGSARMRERPIGELVDALARLGVRAEYRGRIGCPPVTLTPPASPAAGAAVTLPTTMSSQVVSALLLAAPWLPGGLTVRLIGEITSKSYVVMTVGLLERLGATVRTSNDLGVIRVGPASPAAGLSAFDYTVEPDASGATYFWAAAAIIPGAACRIEGLDDRSPQADAKFPDIIERMGVEVRREAGGIACRGPGTLGPVMADLRDMPDAAMTLAVVASFAARPSVLRGLRTLRVKESDRIEALRAELAKIGVRVQTEVHGDPDAITVTPPSGGVDTGPGVNPVEFETYDDHRMAMSLALVGLRRHAVSIHNPRCTGKTYPAFWSDLGSLRA